METVRQQFVEHLQLADIDHLLATVEGAADLKAALEDGAPVPALYVVRGGEKREDAAHTVNVKDVYLIVLVASNVRGPRGEDSSDEAEVISNQVEAWLKDFKPVAVSIDGSERRFIHLHKTGGRHLRFADQKLVWADTYEHKHARRC